MTGPTELTPPAPGGCTGHNRFGQPCGNRPLPGTTVCRAHGGAAPQVQRKARLRAAVRDWQLDDVHEDPGEVLMRMISVSAYRHAQLVHLMQRLTGEHDPDTDPGLDNTWKRQVALLIGIRRDENGNPIGEYRRELVKAEAEERERCAKLAAMAVQAGLEDRRVRLLERQAAELVTLIDAFADGLGLTPEQAKQVPEVAERVLRQVADALTPAVIEGTDPWT